MKLDRRIFSRMTDHLKHPGTVISSKIALYVIAIIAVFFAYQTVQVMIKRHKTETDIQAFEKQVRDLQSTQGRLQELNQFLETDFFAEKEARLKLGMQKQGEEAVVLSGKDIAAQNKSTNPNDPSATTVADSSNGTSGRTGTPADGILTQKQKSNPAKWWNYFFAHRENE